MSKEQDNTKPVKTDKEKEKKYPTKKLAKNRKDGKKWYQRAIDAVKKWFREMKSELKKVVWPNKKQIINNTLVALAVMVIVGVVVWAFDFVANKLVELLKSILKLVVIGIVIYNELKDQWGMLYIMYEIPMMQAIAMAGQLLIDIGMKIALVFVAVAFADYAFQKWKFHEDMKMTKQEVKEEYKSSEGDPAIKGKIRQRMQEASRRRMMQSLPQADVVITNPSHYAVALRYDKEQAEAPYVVAKGADHVALKIKEAAKEHKIEIVENKPLARSLYANVDIGEEIPEELYVAVAEVLAIVYKRTGRA